MVSTVGSEKASGKFEEENPKTHSHKPRMGHLPLRRFWQRRYYDFNVHTQMKLAEKLTYMYANPVKEKLVDHPRDWPWSSWSYYATGTGLLSIDPVKPQRSEDAAPTLCMNQTRKG
jgi:hypothetical protein